MCLPWDRHHEEDDDKSSKRHKRDKKDKNDRSRSRTREEEGQGRAEGTPSAAATAAADAGNGADVDGGERGVGRSSTAAVITLTFAPPLLCKGYCLPAVAGNSVPEERDSPAAAAGCVTFARPQFLRPT